MTSTSLLLGSALFLAFSTAPLPPATFQDDALTNLVAQEVRAASDRSLADVWKRAVELREAAMLGEDGELDRVLDSWLTKRSELQPTALLLVAASRLQGSEPDVMRLTEALTPLLESNEGATAGAAAELLADPAFRTLAPSRRDELSAKMLTFAQDGARSPELRLSFARGAYMIGGGKERIKASKVLRDFLDSQDPELKARGALTMAGLDTVPIEGDLRKILERLSRIPDADGQLASSYLKREELREEKDRQKRELLERAQKAPLPDDILEFLAVLRLVEERHLDGKKVSQERLVEEAINGMLHFMDPHSSLLTSKDFAKFFGELEAEYGGIGAYVNEDLDDGLFTVVRPIYTGPAYRAGLMTDDKIVRIDDWPTLGENVDDIIKRLKGKPGTDVGLYIWRHGMEPELIERPTEDMKVVVSREAVRIPPGSYQMLPGDIGLIQLDTFSQVAMDEARKWIPDMLEHGMKGMILDLRFNGGGLLTEAQKVAELFLEKGKDVVSTEGKDDQGEPRVELLKTRTDPVLPLDVPLVVLVGRSTASAAEIVSGALQDHHRAKLVGKTTYGKGSVQQLIPVLEDKLQDEWNDENGNQLRDPWEELTKDQNGNGEFDYAPRVKLTIAQYKLPSGRSIHRQLDREGNILKEGGVTPDIEVDNQLIEGWRFQERRRVRPEVKKHIEATYTANRELYARLAVNDLKDPQLYPGFDELFLRLDTTLSSDDVRRELRMEVRRRVQDDRGAEFPNGDFVEDVQMQKAIEVAMTEMGKDPAQITEYQQVFDLPKGEKPNQLAMAGRTLEITRALSMLKAARAGEHPLTPEEVDQLIEIIGTIDLRKN